MKKLISLLLSVLFILGLFAGCGLGSEDAASASGAGTFRVGYGKVSITPDFPMSLSGYGDEDTRISDSVAEPIYATCVAFTDANDNTVMLFTLDLPVCHGEVIGFARKDISEATGVPTANILASATHTHASVVYGSSTDERVDKYNKLLREWMLEAALTAMEDRKPAKMYISTVETEGINFVRHYNMKDGSVAGDNFGKHASGYASHVSDPDRTMQFLKFTREGGKDVLLANFQTHPHRGSGDHYTSISADIVGVMRDEVESLLDCKFAYFTGASGNVNPSSKIKSENAAADYLQQGQIMAEYAVEAATDFVEVQTGNVQVLRNVYDEGVPKTEGYVLTDVEMFAFSIGDVGFITAPYEMFSENGVYIKEGSPFEMTFVCTLANSHLKYIPSYEGFEYDGMLSYEGSVCKWERGTGEILADLYVGMLKDLYETK